LFLRTIVARAYPRVIGAGREKSWLFFETLLPLLAVAAYVFFYRAIGAPEEYVGLVVVGGAMTAYWLNVLWSMSAQLYWDKDAGILAAKGIPVTAGPILFSRAKYELRRMTPRNPGLMAKAGVKVAIQTDEMSAVKYLTINAAQAVREGMSEEEALKAITINAAEVIGVEARVGSLEPGKDADLAVLDGHPFDYHTVVELVLIDGQVAYRREEGNGQS